MVSKATICFQKFVHLLQAITSKSTQLTHSQIRIEENSRVDKNTPRGGKTKVTPAQRASVPPGKSALQSTKFKTKQIDDSAA